jgi:spore germination protein KB
MTNKKISTRQLIIFYLFYTFAVKFLMLPNALSGLAGRDAWLSALFGSILELALLFIVLTTMRLWHDDDVYAGLKKKVTPVGAKIVLVVLVIFFLLQSLISTRITNYLLTETIYEDLGTYTFIIPLLLVGIFFCYMSTRAVMRSGEILGAFVILALALALLPSFSKAIFTDVLPVLDTGVSPVFSGLFRNLGYFECSAVLLMFSGAVKIERGFTGKFMTAAALGAVVFVLFVFLFIAVFGPLASSKPLAIVNLTQVSSYIAQNGRIEWLMICVWLMLLIIRFGITFYCAFAGIRYILGPRVAQPAFIAIPIAIVLYIVHAFAITNTTELGKLLHGLSPVLLCFYIAIPVLFVIVAILGKKSPQQKAVRDV